jgi:hypothetical protein
MGDKGARAEACLAADAFCFIDHSYIAALSLNVTRARGTVLNAKRRGTLSALAQLQIFGIASKCILGNLYSGQGIIALPFVDKGTGSQTAATAVTFLRVYHQVGCRSGVGDSLSPGFSRLGMRQLQSSFLKSRIHHGDPSPSCDFA